MSIGVALYALVNARASTPKRWITDWVAGIILHICRAIIPAPVVVTDTGTINIGAGMWDTGDTVEVGSSIAAVVAPLVTVSVEWDLTVNTAPPLVADAFAIFVEL
jgi:hypothetical protein